MNAIKSLFLSLSFSSDLEKTLLRIESSDDHLKPSDEIITKIHSSLIQTAAKNPNPSIEVLMRCIQSQSNWNVSLKMLYATHKLIHIMKHSITNDMFAVCSSTSNNHNHDLANSLRISTQCDEVYAPIAIKYYEFQVQICKNFDAVCECHAYFESDKIQYLNDQSSKDILNRVLPLIKSLKRLFKMSANLSFALENYQKFEITKSVALMVIKESIVIFDFLTATMTLIQERILTETNEVSMQIYNAYEEIVALNKGMERLYGLRNYTFDSYMRKPRYFKLDKQHNKDIELHVNALRQSVNNSNNVAATVEKSLQQSALLLQQTNAPVDAAQKQSKKQSRADEESDRAANFKCVIRQKFYEAGTSTANSGTHDNDQIQLLQNRNNINLDQNDSFDYNYNDNQLDNAALRSSRDKQNNQNGIDTRFPQRNGHRTSTMISTGNSVINLMFDANSLVARDDDIAFSAAGKCVPLID